MFWGTHRVRVDEKGRLAVPATFRRQLPEGSFISIGQDGVLTIYPPELWESLASRLQEPLLGPEQRALARALFSKAVACEFDCRRRSARSPDSSRTCATRIARRRRSRIAATRMARSRWRPSSRAQRPW